jgi:hypothetical protein
MIVDLLVWLGVVSAAFVAWSLYATSGASNVPEDRETRAGSDD